MDLIDAHQHLWDATALRYPWLDGFEALKSRYSAEDYRLATAGTSVVRSVHVEADPAPGCEVTEVAWLNAIARSDGMIGAIVAAAPLESPDHRDILERLQEYPLVVGVRRMAWHRTDPDFYRTPDLIKGVNTLVDFGYSFDLCANSAQLDAAIELVRETPNVSHAINHSGGPDIAANGYQPWADKMTVLASFPNTVCKISGMVTRANSNWNQTDLKPYIEHLIKVFGWDRVLFGSDWPVCTLAAEYGQWLEALNWATLDATNEEKRRLFFDNASRFYRITV